MTAVATRNIDLTGHDWATASAAGAVAEAPHGRGQAQRQDEGGGADLDQLRSRVEPRVRLQFCPPAPYRARMMTRSDSNPAGDLTSGDKVPAPPAARGQRRALNAVDFWRGYALIAIFINHVPQIVFERFTHKSFGISDSSELFVFLAGFSLRYLSESRSENLTGLRLFMRLEARAFTVYAAQFLIVSVALAMMAGAAIWLDTPLILQWNNAASFFENPVATQLGIVMLSHQMGYFDILPLYIALMVFAPLVVALFRLSPKLLLFCSVNL